MIRINDCMSTTTQKAAVLVTALLLMVAVSGFGQQNINLSAAPTTTMLPDGTTVPMWGYFCGTAVSGSTATCAALNPASTTSPPTWSPVVITVPTGQGLTINLTNNLSFIPAGSTTANIIPTSIVIVGQVGGGLGGAPATAASPSHANAQGCVSWFIAGLAPGTPCTSNQSGALPPTQGPRVQSMGTEVTAGATTALTWTGLKPGTYLLESGTHPSIQVPMGLIGVLVVTAAPSGTTTGTAYPGAAATASTAATPAVQYNAEVPLEFSEIDPVQNKEVDTAVRTVNFSESRVWSAMPVDPQGNPGCGNPASTTYHTCYPPAVNYTPFYYLINGVAFNKTNAPMSVFAATAGVVTTTSGGTTTTTPVLTGISGTVLVRLVNAGLRMHVPSIVGSSTQGFNGAGAAATVAGFTLVAEDGNVIPGVAPAGATTAPVAPRVQTDVFMAASKTYDVMVSAPTCTPVAPATTCSVPALPIYDRELSLSGNSSVRDAGMLAYISVNNANLAASLPVGAGSGIFAGGQANPDTYNSVIPCATGNTSCIPLVITDPSKGVMANDVNVYGVEMTTLPANGALTCAAVPGSTVAGICANGTFTYTPNVGAGASATPGSAFDSFGYCANGATAGTTSLCTTVTLNVSSLAGSPTANNITFTSKVATYLKISSPGVLSVDSDPNGLPLQVALSSVSLPACTGTTTVLCGNVDPQGGFTASAPGAGTYTFTYTAQNSQGRTSSAATVTLVFPQPSNLKVNVLDAQAYNNCNGNSSCIAGLTPFGDYRWIIEEDKTFWVDPNCTTNSSTTTPGCPNIVGPSGQSTIPTFGVNFHTSNMDYIAQGCTGPLSCEGGQTMLDTRTACTSPGVPAGCSTTSGQHIAAVCDLGNGACRPDPTGNGFTAVNPSQVSLDPSKRYYISVLPGDAANPFPSNLSQPACPANGAEAPAGDTNCGHTMSGAPIAPACNILGGTNACTTTSVFTQPVNVLVLPTPLPTGKLSVIVFEDDYPLNGEQDGGGGNATVAPIEPGLGGFNIVLWDTYGGLGDVTGQDTYDAFNQPLSNSLVGTIDPVTGKDACPISAQATSDPTQAGITGMIVTCPKYEADGTTLSPLAGQAVIANLMPTKFSVQAYPGADRIARGEEWIQTNTLDGQHPHDSFIRVGEPSYFQEYGPAGYHVAIGFANPAIINARAKDVCAGAGSPGSVGPCTNTIDGQVDVQRLSRTPDQRLYPSGSRDALTWTQCWVSLGDPDGEDFLFTKCDAQGNFKFTSVPGGNWRVTIGDQWNDQIIDGLSTPANVGCTSTAPNLPINATACPGGQTLHLGNVGVQQWQSNLYTRTFIDDNHNGVWDSNEIGIPLIYTMIHYRDGSRANALTTDFNGIAPFNETFPLFNWYVVEADATRYKTTGIHTVYDAGGPADGSPSCGNGTTARQCGTSPAYQFLANTYEGIPLPADLSVPGAVYCAKADCTTEAASFQGGTAKPSTGTASSSSTGRIDPPWVWAEGWSGMTSQGNWIDFGKAPYASCPPACATVTVTPPGATTSTSTQVAENGGIYGQIQYASTRPFDDASQMVEQPWEPYVPHVTVNLYQEGFASDGVTPTLTMVDTTQSSSWDDWAQGFYPGSAVSSAGGSGLLPYMNCPGQGTSVSGSPNQDLFYFTLFDQPNYLDWYNGLHSTPQASPKQLPYNSQYKCYDAMHIWNQLQPAPYDGRYSFPSSLGINPATGKSVTTAGSTNGVVSSMPGTNCTICVPNPTTATKPANDDYTGYDPYRAGTPMLPPGKYMVQVIMPPGYEVYKEEDKNLLIGDDLIAPVTQQFSGLGGDIFILPDQASVASMYDPNANGVNPTNYQDQTSNLDLQGGDLSGVPGFPGYTDPVWPCAGEMRVVPDYLSLFPGAKEVAPFAGATRPLCDRKEVMLVNQMSVRVKFAIFTSTHIASKYTGVITDDFTSEFDPFAPQFGEKFAPPNLPISTKDYLGNELSRVYSDHWGTYDGLTFSSWDVNPPNITGYSPTMMTQCMNDPGPVMDTNPSSPTYGQTIQDRLYNPAYSDFCYEEPYMPGLTSYLDTPVVPTEGFVGAGYNNPDCGYPDATPSISEVDGDGIGPWVSAAAKTLTITALGNQQVNNSAYSGPSANTAPFNLKTVTRHYGFGTRCTAVSATCAAVSTVTIGGVNATITGWTDSQITVTVPSGVPACAIQQQKQYGGSTAECGQLQITAGNGKQSIDAVTVTIGGKAPTHIPASASIQSAIDTAAPGDLLMVDPTCMASGASATCSTSALHAATPTQTASPAAHNEMLIMWKPVRLQGVGAVSSIIDGNAFPAGKLLDPWRRHVNCLFGLTLNGVPSVGTGGATVAYDPAKTYSCPEANWKYYTTPTTLGVPQIDRLPLESVVGWDATVNGNLAEQLQEPSLMGAYEGAGITVLGKGVWTSPGENIWTDSSEGGAFPPDALLLQDVPINPDDEGAALGPQYSYCFTTTPTGSTKTELVPNPYPSNFMCNPSSIDGLTIRDSSQGGGGIFAHGWNHNLQIANNRVMNNAGTLSGGVTVGQGEFPIALTVVDQEGTSGVLAPLGEFVPDNPPSCLWIPIIGTHLPYCLDVHVNVHNNNISSNSSLGDELFSGTLSGGGGASFCTGSDYYKFDYNWVCGNLSSAEGGGVAHLGFIYDGDIQHNTIVLNQSTNPTIPTNGGGIHVMGTPDTDPVCGTQIDADCPPGLSDGTGPGLVINANLIQGNTAESGSGGGIRMQQVNGTDISTFPNGCAVPGAGALTPGLLGTCLLGKPAYTSWNSVALTNNIIVNNVAGWDGAGISLEDSLSVSIINNTVASNDSLASSGVLTQSIGTPESSAPAGNCVQTGPTGTTTASCAQSAGVTSTQNSPVMTTSLTGLTITCPPGQSNCAGFSNPLFQNNLIWQNRSFQIGISAAGTGNLNQQNLVTLYNSSFGGTGVGTASPVTPTTPFDYACPAGATYWDIGVRGDTGPTNHSSGFTLTPTYSLLSDPADYPGGNNVGFNPSIVSQYCNGSRVPPTCTVADGCAGPSGYGVPPGIVDASTPNPRFTLTPSATVDEGNNWINVSWGPLALSDDSVTGGANGNYGGGNPFANYKLNVNSPAIDFIPTTEANYALVPRTDFFGNPRPDPAVPTRFDIGAIEYQGTDTVAVLIVTPSPVAFGTVLTGTTPAPTQVLTLRNDGGAAATGIAIGALVAPYSRTTTCTVTLAAGASCTITVAFAPSAAVTYNASLTITASVTVNGAPVSISGTGATPVRTFTVAPTSLAFGNQAIGTASGARTVTVTNTGNVALAGGTYTIGTGTPEPFSRATLLQGGPGTCGAALAVGASCTYNVVFDPAAGTANGTSFSKTLTVAFTGAIGTGTPVALTGTAITPGTLAFTAATGGTLSTVLGVRTLTFTIPTPRAPVTATVTITNTGGGGLQVTAETLALNMAALYSITGTTCSFTIPLAPGGTCTVSIGYATPDVLPAFPNLGLVSVADNGSGTTAGDNSLALVAR
jgi:hypothetical protein